MKTPKIYKYAIMRSTTEGDEVTITSTGPSSSPSSPSGTITAATSTTTTSKKKNYLPWILAAGVGLFFYGATKMKGGTNGGF